MNEQEKSQPLPEFTENYFPQHGIESHFILSGLPEVASDDNGVDKIGTWALRDCYGFGLIDKSKNTNNKSPLALSSHYMLQTITIPEMVGQLDPALQERVEQFSTLPHKEKAALGPIFIAVLRLQNVLDYASQLKGSGQYRVFLVNIEKGERSQEDSQKLKAALDAFCASHPEVEWHFIESSSYYLDRNDPNWGIVTPESLYNPSDAETVGTAVKPNSK